MRIRLAGTRRGWKKMLPPIERGRLNEQVLLGLRRHRGHRALTGVANSAGNIGDKSYPRNLWNALLLSTVRGRAAGQLAAEVGNFKIPGWSINRHR